MVYFFWRLAFVWISAEHLENYRVESQIRDTYDKETGQDEVAEVEEARKKWNFREEISPVKGLYFHLSI